MRKISPNSCNLLRKPELYMTRKYIFWFSSQLRLYFNPKIVSVFGTWDIKLCSLLSLSPFLPRVEYYFSQQSLSAMKKPPKKYQTITSPKRQLFFIAILWYFFHKKIFLQKNLMEIGLATTRWVILSIFYVFPETVLDQINVRVCFKV